MILFPAGIRLIQAEYLSLLHVENDPEQWLRDALIQKVGARRVALINEWRPRLLADTAVTRLPANSDDLIELIMARSEFRTRLQLDSEQVPPVSPNLHNTIKYDSMFRAGPRVTLAASGLSLSDTDGAIILAYVQDLNDWVLGALLGHINRGKKKMIRQYHPILMGDPAVKTIPANEAALISMITKRADYKTLPEQAKARA